jgi:hypothetical protein
MEESNMTDFLEAVRLRTIMLTNRHFFFSVGETEIMINTYGKHPPSSHLFGQISSCASPDHILNSRHLCPHHLNSCPPQHPSTATITHPRLTALASNLTSPNTTKMGGGPDKEHMVIVLWSPAPEVRLAELKSLFPYIDITYLNLGDHTHPTPNGTKQEIPAEVYATATVGPFLRMISDETLFAYQSGFVALTAGSLLGRPPLLG